VCGTPVIPAAAEATKQEKAYAVLGKKQDPISKIIGAGGVDQEV
jgi:hypothetical protein